MSLELTHRCVQDRIASGVWHGEDTIASVLGDLFTDGETYMVLTAVIRKEDEWFVAECPEVGTASQGKSVEEALANLKEATEAYLEEFPQQSTVHPILTTFEVAAHA